MILYQITNKINGMTYVGQTVRSLNLRINEHYAHDTHLGRAMRKYGKENFLIEVLHTVDTIDELNALEAKYVTQEVVESANTYNYRLGGGNRASHSEETKAKQSAAKIGSKHPMYGKFGKDHQAYGYRHTDEAKVKCLRKGKENGCFGRTGDKHPMFGKSRPEHSKAMKEYYANNPKTVTEETKQKLSKLNKGKRLVNNLDGTRNWVDSVTLSEKLETGEIYQQGSKFYFGGGVS